METKTLYPNLDHHIRPRRILRNVGIMRKELETLLWYKSSRFTVKNINTSDHMYIVS
jgi:hypothetical protein